MHSLKISNGVHYAGHAAHTGKTRNSYRIFVGNPLGKQRRWKYNTKKEDELEGCLDRPELGSCPVVSSDISCIKCSGSTTRELVFYTVNTQLSMAMNRRSIMNN